MRTEADYIYARYLQTALLEAESDRVATRNSPVFRYLLPPSMLFTGFPLITWRKTAWRKALRELEWFMSGSVECPEELRDWWAGQLDHNGHYVNGYPDQLRHSTTYNYWRNEPDPYDQIKGILEGLRASPSGRRHVLTCWNPGEMAHITQINDNPNTPTTCHGTLVQFFVRAGHLDMYHYQRSADLLLGLPHNLVQYWALLTYFAHHTGLKVGRMTYQLGDAHIYDEPSHVAVTLDIIRAYSLATDYRILNPGGEPSVPLSLDYLPSGETDIDGVPVFKASDFRVTGDIPEPVTQIKPKLL